MLPTADEEVKRIFDEIDAKGEGKISSSVLRTLFNNLGAEASDEDMARVVLEFDTDGDGFLNFEEFKAFIDGSSGGDVNHGLKNAFDLFDKDRDGKISEVELHSVLQAVGLKCTVEDCRMMISYVDVDGDGCLDFEEFKLMMTTKLV